MSRTSMRSPPPMLIPCCARARAVRSHQCPPGCAVDVMFSIRRLDMFWKSGCGRGCPIAVSSWSRRSGAVAVDGDVVRFRIEGVPRCGTARPEGDRRGAAPCEERCSSAVTSRAPVASMVAAGVKCSRAEEAGARSAWPSSVWSAWPSSVWSVSSAWSPSPASSSGAAGVRHDGRPAVTGLHHAHDHRRLWARARRRTDRRTRRCRRQCPSRNRSASPRDPRVHGSAAGGARKASPKQHRRRSRRASSRRRFWSPRYC